MLKIVACLKSITRWQCSARSSSLY